MSRVFDPRLICVVAAIVLLAAPADASPFGTELRADCTANSTSQNLRIRLFREGVVVADEAMDCVDGGVTTRDVLTDDEPDAWEIGGFGMCGRNGCLLICGGEEGTHFPGIRNCNRGNFGGIHIMVFRPRPAE